MPTTARTITVTARGKQQSLTSQLTLSEAIQLLKNSTSTFAQDLLKQHFRRGLSTIQQNWVLYLAQEGLDRARAAQDQPRTHIGDFTRIAALFRTAQDNGLTRCRIRLTLPGGHPVLLALVTAGRNQGSIRVTNGIRYGEEGSVCYGFIAPDGTFGGRDQGVIQLLQRFGQDPAAVAAEYGKSTGECCFCGIPLTNGEHGSVSVGYGPICAQRYDLPWEPNGRDYDYGQGHTVHAEPTPEPIQYLTLDRLIERATPRLHEYDQLPMVLLS